MGTGLRQSQSFLFLKLIDLGGESNLATLALRIPYVKASMELVMPFNHVIWLWLLGVWECAAGPLPCVPNYMHLECVSSLS